MFALVESCFAPDTPLTRRSLDRPRTGGRGGIICALREPCSHRARSRCEGPLLTPRDERSRACLPASFTDSRPNLLTLDAAPDPGRGRSCWLWTTRLGRCVRSRWGVASHAPSLPPARRRPPSSSPRTPSLTLSSPGSTDSATCRWLTRKRARPGREGGVERVLPKCNGGFYRESNGECYACTASCAGNETVLTACNGIDDTQCVAAGGLSEPEGTAQLSFTVAGPVERAGALHAEESCTSRWCSGCVFRAFLPCDQRAHSEEASERGGRRDARTWREEMAWRSVGLTGSECLRRTWCHPHLVVSGALRLAQDTGPGHRGGQPGSGRRRIEAAQPWQVPLLPVLGIPANIVTRCFSSCFKTTGSQLLRKLTSPLETAAGRGRTQLDEETTSSDTASKGCSSVFDGVNLT
eukprot:299915-Rhodomonas_salina.2